MLKRGRSKNKYYHASRRLDWKPGDIITSQNGKTIYLTTSPKPHWTLFYYGEKAIGKVRYNVYKVLPLGKVKKGSWDDLISLGPVQILECLGECAKIDGLPSNKDFDKIFKEASRVERNRKTSDLKY